MTPRHARFTSIRPQSRDYRRPEVRNSLPPPAAGLSSSHAYMSPSYDASLDSPQRVRGRDMRLALVASALAIVTCTAVFGAIFLQKVSVSGQEPLPVQAGPSGRQASTLMTADSSATNAAGASADAA